MAAFFARLARPGNALRGIGIAALILIFIGILFPWDSVARRVAHEISLASGSRVELGGLSPALSSRGPVLKAEDVVVDHPALERLRIHRLEIAPRLSTSWLKGEPKLRVWADSEIAEVDGILRLGSASGFTGDAERVQIERLPLRLDASGLALSGTLDAKADVALEPSGILRGDVDFDSDSLIIQSDLLPLAIPFSRASGTVVLADSGATQIERALFEGPLVQGQISGEIGWVHRSLSPPLDLEATLEVVDPTLRQLAPGAGLSLDGSGKAKIHVGGTIDAPEMMPSSAGAPPRRGPGGRR